MSKPHGASSSTKRNGKATLVSAVSPQKLAPRPADDDREAWHAYWTGQGQPWRTEPEIDVERQKELNLRGADLRKLNLRNLPLARACGGLRWNEWNKATEEQRRMAGALLEGANLRGAHLEGSRFRGACFKNVNLRYAHLEESDLRWADLERVDLTGAYLEKSSLAGITISDEKGTGPRLADIHWGDTNIAVVDWTQIRLLGDEYEAQQKKAQWSGMLKDSETRLRQHEQAVRANRQLAVLLQAQGLNEQAARFIYHAQLLQQKIFWTQRAFGKWFFSALLALLAGYGYKPSRSFLAYLLVISVFAIMYYFLGHTLRPALSPLGAFVFSMTSFHGRGFFPGNNISLDNPLTVLAALEALVGLIIEVTFIATLTQRFFNR